MVQILGDSTKNNIQFSISYLDKNEAVFILGLLKSIPCTHCPDFFKGCEGGPTLQEAAMMSDQDYIHRNIPGTEGFLCGKLRNILNLSKAEEQEVNNSFENSFNKRVSVLSQKHDDKSKFVLVQDKDELNSILKDMEYQMVCKLQTNIDKVNKHNSVVVGQMQEKLEFQEKTIKEMQDTIKKLKEAPQ